MGDASQPGNPAHPLLPYPAPFSVTTYLCHRHYLDPRLHLSFQFFIVLLIILLAELILLILFFVYMDKVNFAEAGKMEGRPTPRLGLGNRP